MRTGGASALESNDDDVSYRWVEEVKPVKRQTDFLRRGQGAARFFDVMEVGGHGLSRDPRSRGHSPSPRRAKLESDKFGRLHLSKKWNDVTDDEHGPPLDLAFSGRAMGRAGLASELGTRPGDREALPTPSDGHSAAYGQPPRIIREDTGPDERHALVHMVQPRGVRLGEEGDDFLNVRSLSGGQDLVAHGADYTDVITRTTLEFSMDDITAGASFGKSKKRRGRSLSPPPVMGDRAHDNDFAPTKTRVVINQAAMQKQLRAERAHSAGRERKDRYAKHYESPYAVHKLMHGPSRGPRNTGTGAPSRASAGSRPRPHSDLNLPHVSRKVDAKIYFAKNYVSPYAQTNMKRDPKEQNHRNGTGNANADLGRPGEQLPPASAPNNPIRDPSTTPPATAMTSITVGSFASKPSTATTKPGTAASRQGMATSSLSMPMSRPLVNSALRTGGIALPLIEPGDAVGVQGADAHASLNRAALRTLDMQARSTLKLPKPKVANRAKSTQGQKAVGRSTMHNSFKGGPGGMVHMQHRAVPIRKYVEMPTSALAGRSAAMKDLAHLATRKQNDPTAALPPMVVVVK